MERPDDEGRETLPPGVEEGEEGEALPFVATVIGAPPADVVPLAAEGTAIGPPPTPDATLDAAEPAFEAMPPGVVIGGRYRVERVLGKGAMSVVYEASHHVLEHRVALKCVHPQRTSHPDAVERFLREARLAARVAHPSVVSVFDGGQEGDLCFLAMELLEGEPLSAFLARGPHPLAVLRELFSQLLEGLAAVHDVGAVHRDLKPDNVFLVRGPETEGPGRPVILDFGVSKVHEPGKKELTMLGQVFGSPMYMAPEQLTNAKDVDARADLYAVGVMLYEALAGRPPYDGDSPMHLFQAVLAGQRPPLASLRPDVSERLSAVVDAALAAERGDRFEGARAFRTALRTSVEAGAGERETWSAPPPPRAGGTAPLEAEPTRVQALPGPPPAKAPARGVPPVLWAAIGLVLGAGSMGVFAGLLYLLFG